MPDKIKQSEQGASMVEYALLVALIALVCFAGVQFYGSTVSSKFDIINSELPL